MSPLTLFTTTYMLIGLLTGYFFLVNHRTEVDLSLDMDEVPEEQRSAVLVAALLLFMFGWPVMLAQLKGK